MKLAKIFNDVLMMGLPSTYDPQKDYTPTSKIRSAFKGAVARGRAAISAFKNIDGVVDVDSLGRPMQDPDAPKQFLSEKIGAAVKAAIKKPGPK